MKNEEFEENEFVSELRSLRPIAPRPSVMTSWKEFGNEVESEETGDVTRGRGSRWLLAALICLTAFIGSLVVRQGWDEIDFSATDDEPFLSNSLDQLSNTDLRFEPNSFENRFIGASDDGVIGELGAVSFRRVRYQLVDTYHWANPADGSRLEMMIPREEVLLLPVVTY